MPSSNRPRPVVAGLLTEEEHGRRWLVLAACFLTQLITTSLSYHVGVLNIAVTEYFTEAQEQTISWLMAIYASLFAFGAPVGSAIVNMSSARTCVIISGLMSLVAFVLSSFVTRIEWLFVTLPLAGLGQSLTVVGGCVELAYYFPDETALASGIVASGSGLGNFVHPPLLQVLIDKYTLQGAFLILGAICLNTCATGMLISPTSVGLKKKLERKQNKQSKSLTWTEALTHQWQVLRNFRFVFLLVAVFSFGIAFQAIIVYLPEYLVNSKGYSALEAATVASFVGIGTLFSRSIVGFAATDPKIGLVLMYSGMCLVSSILCALAEPAMEFRAGSYFVSLANGIYGSSTQCLLFPLTIASLGRDKYETGLGLIWNILGLGCLLGPPITAWVFTAFGYSVLFRFSAALFLISAVLATKTHQQENDKLTNGHDDSAPDSEDLADVIFGSQNFEIAVINKREKLLENEQVVINSDEIVPLQETNASHNCDGTVKD